MSIVYYELGQYPAGFVGFRVVVAFGDEYRQTYFSTRYLGPQTEDNPWFRRISLKAQILNAEWEADSLLYQYRQFVTCNYPSTHPLRGTGVCGITLNFRLDRRGKWIPIFSVSRLRKEDGSRKPMKQFYMSELRYSEAWAKAVNFWADEHSILPADRERVLHNRPDREQFKQLRRHINESNDRDIPVEALRPVFREQREDIENARLAQKAKGLALGAEPMKETKDKDLSDLETEVLAWFESHQRSVNQ